MRSYHVHPRRSLLPASSLLYVLPYEVDVVAAVLSVDMFWLEVLNGYELVSGKKRIHSIFGRRC